MPIRKADAPLAVHVPSAEADHPLWARVGVIAAIGFLVGVVWPRVAGVRLGPSVPGPLTSASAGPVEVPVPAPSGVAPVPAALTVPVPAPTAAASLAPAAPAAHAGASVAIGHGSLFSCKSAAGDSLKGGDCGSLSGLDDVVVPRLRRLGDCPEAASASGKLRLVVHPDFARGSVGVELARNPGLPTPEPLLACARTALAGTTLAGIAHENPRYSVLYVATFAGDAAEAPAAAAPSTRSTPATADGTAQIEWDVAIVRDAPKTGKVVARLQRGTEVHVGSGKDGWYPVKYGDSFASDGWLYRGAIGR